MYHTYSGIIYVAGGFNGSIYLDTVESYNPDTDEWTYMSRMSRVRSGISMLAYDDRYLYVVGGFNGQLRLSLCTYYLYDKYINIFIILFYDNYKI